MSSHTVSTPGPSSGSGRRDFAFKLRLIMRTLGTATQKELLALLRQVNPNTGFSPERAYKWIAGRAEPRDWSIYDDLARLIDLEVESEPFSGEQLRTADFDDFYRAMVERYGNRVSRDMAPSALADREAEAPIGRPLLPETAERHPIPHYIIGRYLAISPAWSVYHRGSLVIGEVTVRRGKAGAAVFDYRERLPGGDLMMTGSLIRFGRCLHAVISDADDEEVITMVFATPSAPGALLAGVMSGVAVYDAETKPVAGRIVCIDVQRLQGGAAPLQEGLQSTEATLAGIEAYCPASPDGVKVLLETAGASIGDVESIAREVCGYLAADAVDGLIMVDASAINHLTGKLFG